LEQLVVCDTAEGHPESPSEVRLHAEMSPVASRSSISPPAGDANRGAARHAGIGGATVAARGAQTSPGGATRVTFAGSYWTMPSSLEVQMTQLHALWLPILVAAVIVFVLSAIVHMMLPYHKSDFSKLPSEDAAMDALRPFNIPPGDYMVPCATGPE